MTIDQIIARELLGLRAVSLPYVGTLYAHRTPVHRANVLEGKGSEVRLLPPGIEVSLDGAFYDHRSVIVLMCAYFPELDEEQATVHYNHWVEEASGVEPGVLVVRGVCQISTSTFSLSLDPSTTALLHTGRTLVLPAVDLGSVSAPMVAPRRFVGRAQVRVWPAVCAVVVSVGYILYEVFHF